MTSTKRRVPMANGTRTWPYVRYTIIPGLFVIVIPFLLILLALYPLEGGVSQLSPFLYFGNTFSWTFVTFFLIWAVVFLKIPSKVYYGPTTDFGQTPKYADNGFLYYCATVGAFVVLNFLTPSFSLQLYHNMPELVGNLALVAFGFCLFLWWKGKYHPERKEKLPRWPVIFEFFCGLELHPHIQNINVKQLTNCRIGLMMWQVLTLSFLMAGHQLNGFNPGMVASVLLQSIYIAKFFWWETGYFTTLDITLDRAGFYICFGCLAFLPLSYTYTTYYFVNHPPVIGGIAALGIFLAGSLSIYLNYEVDRQKESFRATDGRCQIWGRKVKFMETEYKSTNGLKKTKLLLSGFWGIARHTNYVFEMLGAFFWDLPGWGLGPVPFFYNIYLAILLIHRIFRDEDKCQKKYGPSWKKYCEQVPYRLVPYVY